MKRATRTAASTLGVYAGLLGVEHGIFETLQGSTTPDGLMINALGAPCEAETVWHACYPALTVVPNFLISGILAILAGLTVLIWAIAFVQRPRGGLILILLSLVMLPVGGGFVPVFVGVVAGVAGTQIGASFTRWRAHFPGRFSRFLARLWPWPLAVLVAWVPGSWLLGSLFNQAMLNLSGLLFLLFDLGLPVLTVLSAFARDIQQAEIQPAP
jgi:hypothetical protein